MQTLEFETIPPGFLPGSVATVGNFDGVHLGHREIIGRVLIHARELVLPAAVVTFDPHPREVIARGQIVPSISSFDERARLIAELAVDYLFKVSFTPAFAALPADRFVDDLTARLRPSVVVIGHDFRFGRDREGGEDLLRNMGHTRGFLVESVPVVEVGGVPVSSTRIRGLIQAGEMARARKLLGAPYRLEGEVVPGHGRGRGLGFATANLKIEPKLLPPEGVYAATASWDVIERPAVVNIGTNPTFADVELTIEAHILDFARDLYARRLRLSFYQRLRGEVKFKSADELREQIGQDVAQARRILAAEAGIGGPA
jgi:riboflavin kinase/FMN adenylyltransferase